MASCELTSTWKAKRCMMYSATHQTATPSMRLTIAMGGPRTPKFVASADTDEPSVTSAMGVHSAGTTYHGVCVMDSSSADVKNFGSCCFMFLLEDDDVDDDDDDDVMTGLCTHFLYCVPDKEESCGTIGRRMSTSAFMLSILLFC